MKFIELKPNDISDLKDDDLRELVARLCEADLIKQNITPSCVTWGGAQEAPDGGLDVYVNSQQELPNPDFAPRQITGFQVKKHSMSKADCEKEMMYEGQTKAVISNLAEQKGAYIIVSGKDSCSDKMLSDRLDGMKKAVLNLPNKEDLFLDFYDRDRLSNWLRQYPGVALWVRSRLGKPLSGWKPFGRWASTPIEQDDKFLFDEHPSVIDTSTPDKKPVGLIDGINLTRQKMRKSGSAVRIIGLSGVGKSRFAQALFEETVGENVLPTTDVIYADLGEDLVPSASEFVSYLIANDFSSYIVLDNCPPDTHRKLQKQIRESGSNLKLLTIEYDISDDKPEETEVIHLDPSSEKIISELLQKRFTGLGRVNADRVAEFSGGNARVAIALASRVDAEKTLTSFTDEDLFQRLFSQRKGATDNLLANAEILSLVYSFNIDEASFNNELDVLAKIGEVDRKALHRTQAELLRRQLAQKRGHWRAVLPHALANRLARRVLENIPINDINQQLIKPENIRLFKSCAHRLGYLHDCEMANQLASTWIKEGGLLYDIMSCNHELLAAMAYIAPLFPEVVLSAIEKASLNPLFTSKKDNPHYSTLVRLLCKLAYEEKYFNRAVSIILKFAETEKEGDNFNNIVNQFMPLFALRLSATQASPECRQTFLKRLLTSDNPRHQEIAKKLFGPALGVNYGLSFAGFDFGARKRDVGWYPGTKQEELEWYDGFIQLLEPYLASSDEAAVNFAKDLLVKHFRSLWVYAGCFDLLERMVTTHAKGGCWPEMWIAIKQVIRYHGGKHIPELLCRIQALEHLTAPSDPYSEMEAYALTDIWEMGQTIHKSDWDSWSVQMGVLHEKIVSLGELAAGESAYLERLAPKLWNKNIDALQFFGEGLALGSTDPKELFERLVSLMQAQNLLQVHPVLFNGFIKGVYSKDSRLARHIQECILEIPELKPFFVYLLCSVPIQTWGVKKLLEIAKTKELNAWAFRSIAFGGAHETISDDNLIQILEAIHNLEGGIYSTLEILNMRLFKEKDRNYEPSEALLSFGRTTIKKLLKSKEEIPEFGRLTNFLEHCYATSSPEDGVKSVIKQLCISIKGYDFNSYKVENLIEVLVKNFPELLLNEVFIENKGDGYLAYAIFKDRISRKGSFLNQVEVKRLIDWCDQNEERIQAVAELISVYVAFGEEKQNIPRQIVLSEHAKALLEVAKDKCLIVNKMAANVSPNSYSGALVQKARSKAFAELLNHPSPEVHELVKEKLISIEHLIHETQAREERENRWNEQSFE